MIYIFLITATILIIIWLLLLYRVNDDDKSLASQSLIYDNHAKIRKLDAKVSKCPEFQHSYSDIELFFSKHIYMKNIEKERMNILKEIKQLQSGNIRGINIFIMPGYVLQREVNAVNASSFRKTLLTKCSELYGRKHAIHKASQLLAKMLSYPIIAVAFTLISCVILISSGNQTTALAAAAIAVILIFVITYAMYDELCDLLNKRRAAICRQFPGVISKLALLVTSGMIMNRAWKETAHSQDTELYMEMRKTSRELDNLVSLDTAFAGFISRCNTKETAKLASAILQNQSKGNAQIGMLLKSMAHEVWQERRHTAKRDAEKANSKLMIPTMLLFIVILVMLMVPIAMNFSGL